MTTDTENGNSDQGNFAAGGAEAIRGGTSRTAVPSEFWDLLHEWAETLDEERRDGIEHRFGELFALAAAPSADKAEAVAWSVTLNGNHVNNVFTDLISARRAKAELDRDYPSNGKRVAVRAVVPLYAAPPTALLRELETELQRCANYLRAAAKDESLGDATSRCLLHERANDAAAALVKLRETLGDKE